MRRDGRAEERRKERNEEFKNVKKKKEILRKVREDGEEGRLDEQKTE
jgi:hypothetical protein